MASSLLTRRCEAAKRSLVPKRCSQAAFRYTVGGSQSDLIEVSTLWGVPMTIKVNGEVRNVDGNGIRTRTGVDMCVHNRLLFSYP